MKSIFLTIILSTVATICYSQTADSLILNNGNLLVGEIKSMDKGVLTIETPYSDNDFKIEWDKITHIKTTTYFLITMSDGQRLNGTLGTTEDGIITILSDDEIFEEAHDQIVYLNSIDAGFWSQLYVSIDVGYSLTKANNLKQGNARSNVGYLAERWSAEVTYNLITSQQDSIEATRRSDANVTFRYFLPKDWYLIPQVDFLSNSEQQLKKRVTLKMGVGKFAIHTNTTYWGFNAGAAVNNEVFTSGDPDRVSGEAYFGTELNMFDIGDLNLLTKGTAYPSLTEKGRWRFDFNFDLKYDLPMEFYVKAGITYNFDNRPVTGASKSDYVFQTTFGWEL